MLNVASATPTLTVWWS